MRALRKANAKRCSEGPPVRSFGERPGVRSSSMRLSARFLERLLVAFFDSDGARLLAAAGC